MILTRSNEELGSVLETVDRIVNGSLDAHTELVEQHDFKGQVCAWD